MGTAAFLIFNAFAMSITELGPLTGRGTVSFMQRFGSEFLAFGDGTVSSGSIVLAVVIGLVVPLLAAFIPARRATRISSLAAMRPQTAFPFSPSSLREAAPGLLGILILLAYLAIAPPGEWLSLIHI